MHEATFFYQCEHDYVPAPVNDHPLIWRPLTCNLNQKYSFKFHIQWFSINIVHLF